MQTNNFILKKKLTDITEATPPGNHTLYKRITDWKVGIGIDHTDHLIFDCVYCGNHLDVDLIKDADEVEGKLPVWLWVSCSTCK